MDDLIKGSTYPECNNTCPECCVVTLEEFQAKADAKIKARSLTLSNVLVILLFTVEVYFQWVGKILNLPEYFYAIALAPYGGAAIGKIVEKLTTRGKKNDRSS